MKTKATATTARSIVLYPDDQGVVLALTDEGGENYFFKVKKEHLGDLGWALSSYAEERAARYK